MLDYLLPVGALPRHVVRAVLAHTDPVTVAVNGNFELVARAFYLEAGAAESQLFAYLRAREFFSADHGAGNISAVRLFDFAYPLFASPPSSAPEPAKAFLNSSAVSVSVDE